MIRHVQYNEVIRHVVASALTRFREDLAIFGCTLTIKQDLYARCIIYIYIYIFRRNMGWDMCRHLLYIIRFICTGNFDIYYRLFDMLIIYQEIFFVTIDNIC